MRPYELGDDVRRIDWNVTARTGEPHVRLHVAERAVETWLVLDTSASMTFGTADRRKWDVAEGVALAVGHVAARRGNRLAVSHLRRPARRSTSPAAAGKLAASCRCCSRCGESPTSSRPGRPRSAPRSAASAGSPGAARSSSSSPTSAARATGGRALLRLAARHDVVAVEIRDPREQQLPDVGDLWLVDPGDGPAAPCRHAQPQAARALRRRSPPADRDEVARELRSLGVAHVVPLDRRRLA